MDGGWGGMRFIGVLRLARLAEDIGTLPRFSRTRVATPAMLYSSNNGRAFDQASRLPSAARRILPQSLLLR